MTSVVAGNYTLTGFSRAFEGAGYNSGYSGSYFGIDARNNDNGGSYDFNYSGSANNDGPQVITSSTSTDAWKISVTITSSTNAPGDFLGYGDFGAGMLVNAGMGQTHTLTASASSGVDLQTFIQGLNITAGGTAGDTIGITFDLVDGNGAFTGTSGTNEATFTTYFVACYAVGTSIATPAGETLIENLRMGDLVVAADGSAKPVKWIGRRSYTAAEIAVHAQLRPVMIRRGALADNMPHRDLTVSPMHGLLIDDVFVPAASLVNNVSILRIDELAPVSYIHLELADHAAIFAEGVPAETFVDDNSRMMFDNADEFYDMFGAEASTGFSAPRLEEGYQLAAIRRRLDLRAGVTPAPVTTGPIQGHVERMVDSVVEGWVLDQSSNAPVELEIMVDGELLTKAIANRYRIDLDHAGLARGRCGFSVALPASVTSLGQVEIRRTVDGATLAMPKVDAYAI